MPVMDVFFRFTSVTKGAMGKAPGQIGCPPFWIKGKATIQVMDCLLIFFLVEFCYTTIKKGLIVVIVFFDNRIKVCDGSCELTDFKIGNAAVEFGVEGVIALLQGIRKSLDTCCKIST